MSRLPILTLAIAVSALALGAIGYAETGNSTQAGARSSMPQDVVVEPVSAKVRPRRPADAVIGLVSEADLTAALLRAGAAGLDAALVSEAARGVAGRAELWLGARVGQESRAVERLVVRSRGGRVVMVQRHGDDFVRRDLVEPVDATPVRIRINGGEQLAAGLVEARLPRRLTDEVLNHIGRSRIAAVDIIVEHESGPSGSHYGQLLYLGTHHADGSAWRWISDNGVLRPLQLSTSEAGDLLRPLMGPITSDPGLRLHPILRYLRWHRGTDFAAPSGTPIQAAQQGHVIAAGWQGGYGRTVRIGHPDGTTTLYAHLSEIDVVGGQRIGRGAVIGKVGASGLATGPHLHFEWRRAGETLRPDFTGYQAAAAEEGRAQRADLRAVLSAPFRLPPPRRS